MAVSPYLPVAIAAANRYGIDPDMFVRQMMQENGLQPTGTSSEGATGIAQIMPDTAKEWGVDPNDPVASLDAAARAMADYTQRFGPIGALVAYNAGPGAVGKPLPAETQQYVSAIAGNAGMATPNDGTQGGFNPNTFDPTDPLTAAGLKFNGAGLPQGFVRGPDGKVYYQDANGTFQPATSQMVANAAIEQQRQVTQAGLKSPPQVITDQRTGEAMIWNPDTQTLTHTGQQTGFGSIDPRELQAADEAKTAAEIASTGRGQNITAQDAARNAALSAAAEQATIANENANRQAQAQMQAASEQGQNFRTMAQLQPALENAALNASKQEADILSNPSDVVARMFQSRGGMSPLGFTSQADQINALRGGFSNVSNMLNGLASGLGTYATPTASYTAPDLGQYGLPSPVSYNPYPFSTAPSIGMAGTPATNGSAAPAAPKVGFQFPTSGPLTTQAPAAAAKVPQPYIPAGMVDTTPNAAGWAPQTGANAGTPTTPNLWAVPNSEGGTSGAGTAENPDTYPKVSGASGGFGGGFNIGKTLTSIFGGGNGTGTTSPANAWATQGGVGYAKGTGFTTDRRMVIGDSLDNRPNPEYVENPTGAPIAIHSPRFGPIPAHSVGTYATGTDVGSLNSYGDIASQQMRAGINPYAGYGGGYANPPTQAQGFPSIVPTGGNMGGSTGPSNPWEGLQQSAAGTQVGATAGYQNAEAHMRAMGMGRQADTLEYQISHGGYTPGNDPNVTASTATNPQVQQAQLVQDAINSSPPAVQALFGNQPVPAYTALQSTDGSGATMPIFTSRELLQLSPDERAALGARTGVQFNAGLPYIQQQAQLNYGTPQGAGPQGNFYMPRGFLAQGMGGFIGI